jgi:hypothetical protein
MANDYTIGRGKPPADKQFKLGQSGNPAGRPKGSKNFKTDFMEEMQVKIEIAESGVKQTVTKQRALIKRMINAALSGDAKHADMVAKLILSFTETDDARSNEQMSEEDLALLEAFIKGQRGVGNE